MLKSTLRVPAGAPNNTNSGPSEGATLFGGTPKWNFILTLFHVIFQIFEFLKLNGEAARTSINWLLPRPSLVQKAFLRSPPASRWRSGGALFRPLHARRHCTGKRTTVAPDWFNHVGQSCGRRGCTTRGHLGFCPAADKAAIPPGAQSQRPPEKTRRWSLRTRNNFGNMRRDAGRKARLTGEERRRRLGLIGSAWRRSRVSSTKDFQLEIKSQSQLCLYFFLTYSAFAGRKKKQKKRTWRETHTHTFNRGSIQPPVLLL